ncbi:hypothetical protein Tco_0710053 [Tanacetum coccineum]
MNSLKINNLTQEILLGPALRLLKGTRSNYAELEYDFEECYKALSEKLDWGNPEGCDYPFDLTKPLPLVMSRNRQKVPVDFIFNNDLKYLQGGIEDMVPNIWVPVKVAYDIHALWGICHWREQHKTFYAYIPGLQSRHDVYSMKRILAVTQVEVMRKHGYGYLKEIAERRAENDLYRFKEGDFPRLLINDIKDMLILVVQNRLINLSGDDVSDFAIALRMFTRSRMELYMQNREHGRMILESVENGPLIWPTVEENGVIRTKKYAELFAIEKIQADCDIKVTNIILQGLPADIYSLVNHHRVAKDLWERVQLLMQGTSLTKQERECKLYDTFDKFTHIKGETLHKYYLRFTQLINDMNTYNMKIEQFQVNIKFLNSLPPE